MCYLVCQIYLFGWKQEFNCVRGIPRTCHFGKSHDASLALGECNNSFVISEMRADARSRWGRFPQMTRYTGFLSNSQRYAMYRRMYLWCRRMSWGVRRRRFSAAAAAAAQLLSVGPPPALPVHSRSNQWVCLQWEERGGGGGDPSPRAGNEVRQRLCTKMWRIVAAFLSTSCQVDFFRLKCFYLVLVELRSQDDPLNATKVWRSSWTVLSSSTKYFTWLFQFLNEPTLYFYSERNMVLSTPRHCLPAIAL